MEEKSPCNSRPIVGIATVGGHETKDKEQFALLHFTKLHFPRRSRSCALHFFGRSNAWTGSQMSRRWPAPHQANVIWDTVTYYHRVTTVLLDGDGFWGVCHSTVQKKDLQGLLIWKRMSWLKKLWHILQKQKSLDSRLMAGKVTDLQESLDSRKVEFTLKNFFKNPNHKTHDIMKKS